MAQEKIFEIGLEGEQFVQAAQEIQKEIVRLSAQQTKLKKNNDTTNKTFIENGANLKILKSNYRDVEKQIIENNKQSIASAEISRDVSKEFKKEAQTVNEANQQITRLNKIKKSLIVTNKEEKALLDQINKKIDDNTEFVKENSSEIENQKINIGNYGSAVKGLSPTLDKMLGSLNQIQQGFIAQKSAMKASTASVNAGTKSFKFFRIALISTGIGALVVALGSLIVFLTKSQKGMDKVSIVMAQIGSVVDVVVDRLIAFGEILSKVFDQSLLATVRELTGTFEGMGDEIVREIELVKQLELATQALRDTEISQIAVTAERRVAIENLRFAAKNELETIDRRVELLKAAQQIEKQSLKEQTENANERLRIAEQELERATSTADDIKKVEELKAEVSIIAEQTLKRNRTLEAELQSLQKRGRAADLKAFNERKKQREAEAKAIEKEQEKTRLAIEKKESDDLAQLTDFNNRKRDLQNQIDIENAETDEQKALLKAEQDFIKEQEEIENLKLTAEQRTELLALIEIERGNLINDIKEDFRQKNLTNLLKVDKATLDADKRNATARANIASTLTGILQGLLGDSLGAKIASIAIEAGIQSGLVAIDSSAAQARNLAQATAALPPPLNAPLIVTAGVQNAVIASSSTTAISKILGASALKALGTLASSKFQDGGMLTGASHSNGGIPFTVGGKSGFEAEGGEAIINKNSSALFRPLLSALNVAGGGNAFADGGIASVNPSSIDPTQSLDLGTLRVINIARDTIDVAQNEIEVENFATI